MKSEIDYQSQREYMVKRYVEGEGVCDPQVIQAMLKVPRHKFVPEEYRDSAYGRDPLSIGYGQTISAPYIVGYMTERLRLTPDSSVLEIGTGCGYQTAILAEIARKVYTIEIIPELAESARKRLENMGYTNIEFKIGNGSIGWEEKAPFDAIIGTAAAKKLPSKLLDQLKDGGRMILPVGKYHQRLYIYERHGKEIKEKADLDVIFVPMVNVE